MTKTTTHKQKETNTMKFTKDKEYSFISYSNEFKAVWIYKEGYEPQENIFTLRWAIHNHRGCCAYDKPMCESKEGRYVRANYTLSFERLQTIPSYETSKGEKVPSKKSFLEMNDRYWNFETRKEMMDFLNKYMEHIENGTSGLYGYYNSDEFKLI